MRKLVVVEKPNNFSLKIHNAEIVSARDYLTGQALPSKENIRIFNLCRDYSYQSKGYYVSLLAEARGHKVLPSVKNIQDLKTPTLVRIVSDELDDLIQHSLKNIKTVEFELSIYFGQNLAKQHYRLSREIHKLFPAPFLRAKFAFTKKWILQSVKAIPVKDVPEGHYHYVEQFAAEYFRKKRYDKAREDPFIYDLAILVNPAEKEPPSDKKALQKFVDLAEKHGFSTELITREDYSRVGEFDALFIRETTSVNHHTYLFARRAESDGLVVIDDPDSILRCTNKVYLAELLQNAKIPTPKTVVIHGDNLKQVGKELGFPCILKLPDSSFSQGVIKVTDERDLKTKLNAMLQQSDLVIAQNYMPTDFDWRIGVLDNKPLFACKYYMAKGHWQIYNWNSTKETLGRYETLPVEQVPQPILDTALKAARLVGKGLYGVDLKEYEGKPYVIEINDNPNIDSDVEDQVRKDSLYEDVILSLKRRIEEKLGTRNGDATRL